MGRNAFADLPMTSRLGSLVAAVALTVAVAACTSAPSAGPHLLVDCAAFDTEGAGGAVVERQLEAQVNQTVQITVCANPSTGFSWEEPTVEGGGLEPVEHGIDQVIGVPGKDSHEVFVLRTTATGDDTIHFVYSQPWEGGEKGAWRLDVAVAVTPAGG